MSRPRFLLAVSRLFEPTGGIDVVNRLVVHALAEHGCEVDILSLADSERTPLDARYISSTRASYRAFGGSKLRFVAALYRQLVQRQYDLIMFDLVNLAAAMTPWRLAGRRYYVWLFGIDVFPPNPNWEGRLGLKFASGRLAISEHTRRAVQTRFPQLEIVTCPLALDPIQHSKTLPISPPNPGPHGLQLPAVDGQEYRLGPRVLLHVGRMVRAAGRDKGQEVLLQAMPHILAVHPEAQLVLAGTGPQLKEWRRLARSLPGSSASRIFMPGYVNEDLLRALYEHCFAFVMPSIGEGFGLVYLEAMSHARPCIGARVDATPEIISHNQDGLLVHDPTSVDAVAAAVNSLLADEKRARAMGLAGYAKVRNHYLFEHFSSRFWTLLQALCAELAVANTRGKIGS